MGAAEVISFEEVRARKQWDALRGQLHTRFDQWLDGLEQRLPEPATTLAQVSDIVWQLRQDLTGGLTETILTHAHAGKQSRKQTPCPPGLFNTTSHMRKYQYYKVILVFSMLLEIFKRIPDHRRKQAQQFDVPHLLLFTVLAIVSGAHSYRMIHGFIKAHFHPLQKRFKLS